MSSPAGLRRRIESVLSRRSHGAAEIWGEVRDWLEEHGGEIPDSVRVEQPPEGGAQRVNKKSGARPLGTKPGTLRLLPGASIRRSPVMDCSYNK